MVSEDIFMSKTKTKGFKIVLSVIAAIIALALIYEAAVWFMSDRIVKLSFNGFENFFTVHDEYYAVAGPFRAPVPKALVQTACENDAEYIGEIDKEAGKVFFVQVNWSETGRPVFEGTTTLIHPYSNKYVFEVTSPGPDECVVSREEERMLLDIAEHFYDFEQEYTRGEDNWVAYTGTSTTIFSFKVTMNGDKSIFSIHQPGKPYKVYSYDNGRFTKIMNVPDKGDYDVTIWKQITG